jgi:hypothetical protein
MTVSSWKSTIPLDTAVVPISPLTTVDDPELVIPATPPKSPKRAAVPSGTAFGPAEANVVKLQGFGSPPDPSGLLVRSVAPEVMFAV